MRSEGCLRLAARAGRRGEWDTRARPVPPFWPALVAIAATALAVRIGYAFALAPDGVIHRGDPRYFHLVAGLIAGGHGFIEPLPWLHEHVALRSTEHPPLWPLLLSLAARVGAGGWAAQRILGCVVGATTVTAIGLAGRRVGGERLGLGAAAIAAIYLPFVAIDGSLMSEPLFALCVTLSVLAALRAAELPSPARGAVLGLSIGVAALVRGEALALLVLLAVPVLSAARSRREKPPPDTVGAAQPIRALALAVAVALVVIAPWCVRNSLVLHRPTLVSSEDGAVLAGANCAATYRGVDIGYWRAGCARGGSPAALRGRAARYAGDHAGRLPAVASVRLLRTFGLWQPRRMVFFAEGRRLPGRALAEASYLLLAAFALLALLTRRTRRERTAILLAPALLAALVSLAAFGDPRFRYAADPAMLVLAAGGVAGSFKRIRARARPLRVAIRA